MNYQHLITANTPITADDFNHFSKTDWAQMNLLVQRLIDWFIGEYMDRHKLNQKQITQLHQALTFLNNVVPFSTKNLPQTLYRAFWLPPGVFHPGTTYRLKTSLKPIQSWTISYERADDFLESVDTKEYLPKGSKKFVPVIGASKDVSKFAWTSYDHLTKVLVQLNVFKKELRGSTKKHLIEVIDNFRRFST